MTDILDRLLESEVERRVRASQPAVATSYGVWIAGKGWMRHEPAQSVFATWDLKVARTAVGLWGRGARILPFDASLVDFESILLERERVQHAQRWQPRFKRWWQRTIKHTHGLFKRAH